MNINRRDWLKTAFLGSAALTLSPLEFLANETPNFNELKNSNETIRLCFNENPFGTSPKALEAMQKSLSLSSRYDFKLADVLCEKIAGNNNVKKENILVSAGSSFLLELITKYVSLDKGHIIIPDPSFTIFAPIAEFLGMSKSVIELNDKKKIDLEKMKNSIQKDTKLIYICNPNNPTGDLLSRLEIENFIKSIPDNIIVLVDEAYIEFVPTLSCVDLTQEYDNVIVLRSFSKAYGLAALRIGYAVSSASIAEILNYTRQSFNTSTLAHAAATAAIKDQHFINQYLAFNHEQKQALYDGLDSLGVVYVKSATNFVMVNVGDGMDIYQTLIEQGVVVRPMVGYGLPAWIRVSVGLPEEINRFLDTLAQVLS